MDDYQNMTPLRVCKKKKAFTSPENRQALCTYYLKTNPFHDWLNNNYPADFEKPNRDIKILYGFDASEKGRIQRRAGILGAKGYYTDFPLAFWNRTIHSTEEIGIAPPDTYKIFKHANCIGCLKAGMQHWYTVYCLRRDIFKEALEVEEELSYSIIKDYFLKDLTSRFDETISKGVCPNDKENGNAFWSKVNQIMPEQISLLPCDCAVL